MDQQNTHEEKFRSHEIHTRKNFGSTKYSQEKISEPQNIHEKKIRTHKILTRKIFELTKYLQRHGGKMALDPQDLQWHMTVEI